MNTPKSIELKGESYLTPEAVEDVHAASLGYSITSDETNNWDGLVINDPFNMAQGVVNVVIDGVESMTLKVNLKIFNWFKKFRLNNISYRMLKLLMSLEVEIHFQV